MILLFTDFGLEGPYTGQMKAVLMRDAPGVPVLDLFADAPAFSPKASAYLLAAYQDAFPEGAVFLSVVDPGVGGGRDALVATAFGRWFVGPDNGLFEPLLRRDGGARAWRVTWRPERLSASFHGRDLFAPVAARLARGGGVPGEEVPLSSLVRPGWPDDLDEIVYVDRYGNAMTGLRAGVLGEADMLRLGGEVLRRARTFSDRPPGEAFWYENANGLVEIAVNGGSAADRFGLRVGSKVGLPG